LERGKGRIMKTKKESALDRAKGESEDVDVISCPDTDKELYFASDSNHKFVFESYGTCVKCNIAFHTSALKMSDGMTLSSWPVHYLGYYCKTCYYKDDNAPIKIVKIKAKEELEDLEDLEEYLEVVPEGAADDSGIDD
jgi:hypothetical protein